MIHEYNLIYIYADNDQSAKSNKQDA